MKCNPLRWLWGLFPVALLGWLVVHWAQPRIEADLRMRVDEALSANGLEWGTVAFRGRDGVVQGKASDDAEQKRAVAFVQTIWGVRSVEDRTALIEEERNYVWTAALRDNRLKLSGLVPNEQIRRVIIGAARATFPQREIQDLMKLARGVPDQDIWLGGVSFGLKQLAGLKGGGRVDLDGVGLVVEGEADDFGDYKAIKTALSTGLPTGIKLKADKVAPPVVKPFAWSAKHIGHQVQLSGHVPNDKARDTVFAAAKAAFPNTAIIDRMQTAGGEPKDWQGAATAAIGRLAELVEGSVETRDSQLLVSGTAETEAAADAVKRSLKAGVPSSFRVTEQIKFRAPTLEKVHPFTTAVAVEGDAILLTGYVPNDAARAAVVAAVRERLPGKRVEDRLALADGASEGWQGCAVAGIAGLGRLGNGRLTLSDRALSLTAATEDDVLATAVPGDLRGAVHGACDVNAKIAVTLPPEPSLTWRAARVGSEIILEGEVTDADAKAELLKAAGQTFPGARVIDRMTAVSAPSKTWPRVAETAVKLLAKLTTGEAKLIGQQLMVTGEAEDALAAGEVRRQLAGGLARGYSGRDTITVRARPAPVVDAKASGGATQASVRSPQQQEVDRCQQLLTNVARTGTIHFDRASAELDPESLPTLKKLAEAAQQCSQFQIEIGGHTDTEGTPERNQRLSARRAQAVVDFLTKAGVAPNRLAAVGHGQDQPVASNDTPEDRAKNRRIEFKVSTN
jgi:outer membrane protein OmpA-like peptidoglycan-associated protein/osmotically-inducible protein OsmY